MLGESSIELNLNTFIAEGEHLIGYVLLLFSTDKPRANGAVGLATRVVLEAIEVRAKYLIKGIEATIAIAQANVPNLESN